MKLRSTKVIDGFSTCFRQWRAEGTHCKFLHGYGISFYVEFEGALDDRNWVVDFGGLRRSEIKIDGKTPRDWFNHMFDHTTVIAKSDPMLPMFFKLEEAGLIQLRVLPEVGCELFAEYVFNKLDEWVSRETNGRVKVIKVECKEHAKNSAIMIR